MNISSMLARRVITSIEPLVVLVVGEDAIVQLPGLLVGDRVEIDSVQIAKRRQQVAIEARGPGVVEIVLAALPTSRRTTCPSGHGDRRLMPGKVAAGKDAVQRHSPAPIGLVLIGNFAERPQMVVRVDGRHGVERGLDAGIQRRRLDVGRAQRRGMQRRWPKGRRRV